MESKKDTFECELCGLTAPYSYYGHKPPNAYSVTLLEDCYVMKDPFIPDKDRFLILGAQCSVCHKRVCVGPVACPTVAKGDDMAPEHCDRRKYETSCQDTWFDHMTRGMLQQSTVVFSIRKGFASPA